MAAADILKKIGQAHLLENLHLWSKEEQSQFEKQIASLDLTLLKEQQALLLTRPPLKVFEPFPKAHNKITGAEKRLGEELLKTGALAALIVAGGQSTRLGLKGPKGAFAISPIKEKSLFQLLAEKTLAASRLANRPLQLGIMTSINNEKETLDFFKNHNYFGLKKEQVDFFTQDELPFLDKAGHLFMEKPGLLAMGPDGNGQALKKLFQAGIWEKWHQLGIKYIHFGLIDNPLADPFDFAMAGFHATHQADMTLKCVVRDDAEEKVGLLGMQEGKSSVIEYSEAPIAVWEDIEKYPLANISLFYLSMDFVRYVAEKKLPLHLAYKPVKRLSYRGNEGIEEQIKGWKFEHFIFDTLAYAKKVEAIVYPRESTFAPLKSREGPNGVEETKKKMIARDKQIFSSISSLPPPDHPFELAQDFYYPTEDLKKKWHKKSFDERQSYIEP